MKILITGAHFTPAQSIIEELLKVPDIELVYLGRKYARDDDKALSVESQILPKLGVKFIPIVAGKLNRFFSFGTIISFLKTPVGFIQSFYYLMKESPDLIISFGGFTGMPVVVSGWFLSVPSLIHEQSLNMGLANYISSFFADRIAVSFSDFRTPTFINSDKIVVTGNPVREDFFKKEKKLDDKIKNFVNSASKTRKPLILITAGNQGSHKINLLVEDTLIELSKVANIIHQTGDSKFNDFANLEKHQSGNYLVRKWISVSDFSFILENIDLAISRSGMNTLIELALNSVPTMIVPIPVGTEQQRNGHFFAKAGLGEVVKEDRLNPETFLSKIKEMIASKAELKKNALESKKLIVLDAKKRLMQEILIMLNSIKNFHLKFK